MMRVLTAQQRQLIELFIDGELEPQQLWQSLGKIPLDTPSLLLALLESAVITGKPAEAELAFAMLRSVSDKKQFIEPAVPLLLQFLTMDNHYWHEDIIGAFRYMKDARTIDGVFEFVSTLSAEFINNSPVIIRKATWALANVGNENAYRKLELLAAHAQPLVREYARRRLDAWDKEQGRKSFRFTP